MGVHPDTGRQGDQQERGEAGGRQQPHLDGLGVEDEHRHQRKGQLGDLRAEQRHRLARPQPAAAPEPLALVQDFLNTVDLEAGVEQLAGPEELGAWLVARGLLGRGERVRPGDLERARAVRSGLRELAMANAGLAVDQDTIRGLDQALDPVLLRPGFDPGGGWRLEPGSGGSDGALARLAAIVVVAMHGGSWSRLKPCRNHLKARAYRHRRS